LSGLSRGAENWEIVVGRHASATEHYAAAELQRYLYQLSGALLEIKTETSANRQPAFVVGQVETNSLLRQLVSAGRVKVSEQDPGPQGYVLKRLAVDGRPMLVIAGSDAIGCLYGVYGLLEDHYGVGLYLGGDVLPEKRPPDWTANVDERKLPAVAIRGFLPWTNFPQSATVYSWEDWRFILDQMAKMRMNFLHIHNYNETGLEPLVSKVPRHNEMFHNFTYHGITSRVWMATVRTGHFWWGPPWDLAKYRFGAGDLFDDYDFGADCALHNENLSNEQVFRKGVSLFQKVIAYAHGRGVKVGLGLDINLIPGDYKAQADDPGVVAARVDQIASDYPDLDYLLCFQSEGIEKQPKQWAAWRRTFKGFYEGLNARSPGTRLAVAGWGLDPVSIAQFPKDVICAPISAYSDSCENGAIYGQREYWGCPWLERDGGSSEYYYPYNTHLSNTIKAWQNRAPNMKGFYCLTWRLTDAIDAKMSYMAKAPWDQAGKYASSRAVYRQYAAVNYGEHAADRIAAIIDQNEPVASTWGECGLTPCFKGGADDAELKKAIRQLAVIDQAIAAATSADCKARLRMLRCRIAAEKDHIELDHRFKKYAWADLPGAMESWTRNFIGRVSDISSLGNVTSTQNRFVQENYVAKENRLRKVLAIQPPTEVVARGLRDGAVIRWTNEEKEALGFHIYRDGSKLTNAPLPLSARSYLDKADGRFRYAVSAVTAKGESLPSVPWTCEAGRADRTPPQAVVISPPTSVPLGQPAAVKVRALDGRAYELISATLYWRKLGAAAWEKIEMTRRVKSIFAAAIPVAAMGGSAVEYYVEVGDGDNAARFPASAPRSSLSLIVDHHAMTEPPSPPAHLNVDGQTLKWAASDRGAFCYRIYRSAAADFMPGPATFLTYVPKETCCFKDNGVDFAGRPLQGTWYYRVTSADKADGESGATAAVRVSYPSP
jgi:hypothetical protein